MYLCARFCIRLHRWLLYGAERVRLWCCLWLVEYLLPPVGNARSRSPLPLFVACCTGVCVLCCGISFCLCVRHGRGAVALRVSVGLKCHGIEDLGVIEIQIYKQTSVQMYKYTNIQIYKCTKCLIPDIILGQFLGRFWAQIWVNFGPKIDPALIQQMSGYFGTPKDAKWDAQRSQKVAQNGLTPTERMQVEGKSRGSRGQVGTCQDPGLPGNTL